MQPDGPIKDESSNNNNEEEDGSKSIDMNLVLTATQDFYRRHSDIIKESHGWSHAKRVYEHSCRAVQVVSSAPSITATTALLIQIAALLHDVDDSKYFPNEDNNEYYKNAQSILRQAKVPRSHWKSILFMIDQVSCSKNGNRLPQCIVNDDDDSCSYDHYYYYWLIPRWADRIEAVGARGVWRCYQYNREHGMPLCLDGTSPRPRTVEEVYRYATRERFEAYQTTGGRSTDMISHYYDKLLHVACPPKEIVRNSYLEEQLQNSAKELIEVCLRYGKTGVVDEEYIQSLANTEHN